MSSILSIREVSKSYGPHKALDRVSLEIPENRIFGLLGPNGAGKTTLIRIINQILVPDAGSVLLDGKPLRPEHVAQIGYLPEERGLYKSMKVGEQALYLAQLKGLSRSEARKRLQYWFEKLEIGDWWGKKVQELSKGMAQKIQFIVTVLHQPKLLIFDEPFSGFDPINAALIKDQILELREAGASIIFSTHRMESVEELCEYIGLIHRSQLILEGRLSDIKKAYKQNRFRIEWAPERASVAPENVLNGTPVETARFDPEEQVWDFTVRLPDAAKKGLLNALSEKGSITSFRELVPTANDIFIETVQNKEANG
ncbi:ABC transporter ATP-binding protein [Robiginitalea biformata]|uniref:ABC transporter, ATP-binding protein n=1 Tax=Robiginitalea biformata (strain ATCC BAA-864 / DSM 15991 / KCTC 12146 / HTCC2501) TaxID=313596 RepID=A4CMJ6_ROBBH|nr:ATP-binding cassette domain-containing protein [Robiginitalea biformata]EAR14888.1 ABC transporter, ATP-binding protein [Robiginitalea biformata HTCC2501]